jgi:glycosyltransferase involved in cell wall biosynthesis
MIVRNEEQNLAACLEPIASLVDEIIVVDTGSQDKTREIASRFSARVFDFEWCDDYAAARNESLAQATGDYIFWLDADDRLDPLNIARLAALFSALDDQPRVFHMNCVSRLPHQDSGTTQATHPRLFYRHPELRWSGRVHEQLSPLPNSLGLLWTQTDIEIQHTGYQDAAACRRKLQQKLRLLRMDYATDPNNLSTLFHLGMTLREAGHAAEARKHLSRVAAIAPAGASYLSRVFSVLAELSIAQEQFAEALQLIERGLQMPLAGDYLQFLKAFCLDRLGQPQAACQILMQLMTAAPSWQFLMGQPGNLREQLIPRLLAEILGAQGAIDQARALLEGVLRAYPLDAKAWFIWALTCIAARDESQLQHVLERLAECPAGEIQAKVLRIVWHLRIGPFEPAGDLLDDVIAKAPTLPFARMLRVEWLSRSGAPIASQIRAVRDVLRLAPNSSDANRWLKNLQQQEQQQQPQLVLPPPVMLGAANNIVLASR